LANIFLQIFTKKFPLFVFAQVQNGTEQENTLQVQECKRDNSTIFQIIVFQFDNTPAFHEYCFYAEGKQNRMRSHGHVYVHGVRTRPFGLREADALNATDLEADGPVRRGYGLFCLWGAQRTAGPSTPLRSAQDDSMVGESNDSHPSRKNKNAARVGHPELLVSQAILMNKVAKRRAL
jgi:hypothetical protein